MSGEGADRARARQGLAAAGGTRVYLLGVPVDRVTLDGAMERVSAFMAEEPPRAHLIYTPNPEIVDRARRDPGLLEILSRADLAVPDSALVLMASRWVGRPVPERVPGADLASRILREAAARGWPVYLLGARPGVAEKAAARATAQYPGLSVCGTRDGYFGAAAGGEVAGAIRDAGAAVVIAGMGAPKQEKWMSEYGAATGARVLIGVGGYLDVLSGEVQRAPEWMRRLYLEWLYRVVREPARWRRLGALPRFAWAVWRTRRHPD